MDTAADIMTTEVFCIPADVTVENAARMLLDNHISGAPVVDRDGGVIGIISEYNLLAMIYDATMKSTAVKELVSKEVVSVDLDTKLHDVANLFIVRRIRRVPVLSKGKLVGIISRPELLRYALDQRAAGHAPQLVASR